MDPNLEDPQPLDHSPRNLGGYRLRYLAHAGGWVMCQRDKSFPYVLPEPEWEALRKWEDE